MRVRHHRKSPATGLGRRASTCTPAPLAQSRAAGHQAARLFPMRHVQDQTRPRQPLGLRAIPLMIRTALACADLGRGSVQICRHKTFPNFKICACVAELNNGILMNMWLSSVS